MCIICASPAGVRQPTDFQIKTMFAHNPHGAGYMYARDGKVFIHKGFMNLVEFMDALKSERFTAEDSVVYHFRISTQAGVCPEMTHPFPLSNRSALMRKLDLACACGVAHNGIIPAYSDPNNKLYSDTAMFITEFLSRVLKSSSDLHDPEFLKNLYTVAQSKLAIMDGSGYIATVGEFRDIGGLLFSNYSFLSDLYALRMR